jgi:hypothetical protein
MSEVRDELKRNLQRAKKASPTPRGAKSVGDQNNPKLSWQVMQAAAPASGSPFSIMQSRRPEDIFETEESYTRNRYRSDYQRDNPSPTGAAKNSKARGNIYEGKR